MKPLASCQLYTFVDTAYLHGRSPTEVAKQLCDGGSDIIQLRAKTSLKIDIEQMAAEILPICEQAGVWFVINDHLDIAQKINAPIVHLGQEDFFDAGYTHVSELPLRRETMRVGLSTHAPPQAQRAITAAADYIAIGPIYATATKPTARPVTLDYVRWAAENVRVAWFAIGGINFATIDDVLAAGARRICVVSAILNAPDIAKTCSEYKKRLLSAAAKVP